MKKWGVLILVVMPVYMYAQNITTFAGTGSSVFSGEGVPATSAGIPDPIGGFFDRYGNYFFADGLSSNRIRKINISGIITTVAGNGSGGLGADGIAATASAFNFPNSIKLDTSGNMYIVDGGNHRVRKVNAATGIVSTIAGMGSGGFSGDGGVATLAKLYNPQDICIDNQGNLYIADYWNNRIRKIDPSGVITTFAGGGTSGVGDNGPATAAELVGPWSVEVDNIGNVYLGENSSSSLSNRVRKIDTFGIITTIAGNGGFAYSGDGIPATAASISPIKIAFDTSWQLFVADEYNRRVYKIDNAGILHLVAGNGATGFTGDGGPATAASIHYPSGIIFDPCGNLFIADVNNRRVRKVNFNPTCNMSALSTLITKKIEVISIYPNPANDELQIENVTPNSVYIMYNMVGEVIKQSMLPQSNNTIPLGTLPQGMYMLQITDVEGERAVYKIMKD